jgi:superfamily II DNA/RNA helicase
VTTLGSFLNNQKGRKKIDISSLKCLVIDEADFFFVDDRNYNEIKKFNEDTLKSLKL